MSGALGVSLLILFGILVGYLLGVRVRIDRDTKGAIDA